MAFGKRKKKKEQDAQEVQQVKSEPKKSVKVDMKNNPLYPPKKESDMQELLIALGTTVVCLILVVLISGKFSYMNQVNAYGNSYSTSARDTQTIDPDDISETEEQQTFEEENLEEETVDSEKAVEEKSEDGKEKKSDYIIADSDSRYLSASDLEGLSAEELSRARNEIYARHGRKFKDAAFQSYFDSKSWYNGTIEPEQFTESMLNECEKKNAETILAYEKSKGYK